MTTLGQVQVASPPPVEDEEILRKPDSVARKSSESDPRPTLIVDTANGLRRSSASAASGRASSSLDSLDNDLVLPPQVSARGRGGRRSQDRTDKQASSSARYVTVSSILSRSGAAVPLSTYAKAMLLQEGVVTSTMTNGQLSQHDALRPHSMSSAAAKRASNGSALEALGALFLQQDSTGKVSNLSFMRYSGMGNTGKAEKPKKERKVLSTLTRGLSGGATRLGIRMPKQDDAGETIAQRRARKIGSGGGDEVQMQSTRRNEPTFEVLIANPTYPTILPSSTSASSPPPAPRLAGKNDVSSTPPPLEEDIDIAYHDARNVRQAPLTAPSAVYGPGSAFSWIQPPELPPSPIAMPGAWLMGQNGWNSDRFEEGALLLPPPLLDDHGSDAQSFEGLLGVRRMREQERARKQLDKLKARNRPAHKIGMMTAFSNFIKAAHAADRATRASAARTRMSLPRRHTEPIGERTAATSMGTEEKHGADADRESIFLDPTTAGAASTSLESVGRQLDTVYEASSASVDHDRSIIAEEDVEDDAISDIDVLEGCDAQKDDDGASHTEGRAAGSSRLSVRSMSKEDVRTLLMPSGRSSLDSDRRSMRGSTFSLEPLTPRIGPTMLSLPPSPWTPYGAQSRSGTQTPYFVQLGMTPVVGALPGTPRLMPALLEVLSAPSPFPFNAGMTPLIRSPRGLQASSRTTIPSSSAMEAFSSNMSAAPSPLVLSPSESPMLLSTSPRPPSIRRRKTVNVMSERADEQRLTPMASMTMTQDQTAKVKLERRASQKAQEAASRVHDPQKRSFILWFLFGDLGLGTRAKIAARADDTSTISRSSKSYSTIYVGLIVVSVHTYGFTVFLLAHLVDLSYRIAEFLATAFWFLRWMTLNITGQTVLARCVIDAYNLVAREWETVSKEDHEGKADDPDAKQDQRKRGLSKWQVLKGFLELYCLQDVTRQQYLKEGAGLQELTGWKRRKSTVEGERGVQLDLGAMRAADRKAREEDEDTTAEHSDNDDDDDDDDDDDEMVVTRRGPDILEFTKTPRVEPRQYFGSFSESDGGGGDDVKRRQASLQSNGRRPSSFVSGDADTRQLVKTIKWASRLAISAYGLHVTLVDLPPTFTPSGDRFSRQTFAHLSRLHHEDVLHADIQTLDSADYSPTFYLVRDYSRRCVAVSVRGTQSLQDIIVDLDLMVDQVKLPNKDIEDDNDDDEPLYCHAGILRAAQALIDHDSTLFRTLRDALNEHADFSVVFTGHSLGGAIASAVVLLLSRYETSEAVPATPGERADNRGGRWVTHDRSGLPSGRAIRAITFAHPATFNAKLASRAATGHTPLVLSVTLGHDIIPRCGHGQARELRRVLGALSRVRRRKEAGGRSRRNSIVDGIVAAPPAGQEDDARVHIFTSWRAWRAIKAKGRRASAQEEEQAKRIEEQLWRLRCDVEGDLYSAVKRRSQESSNASKPGNRIVAASSIPPSPWIGPWQQASVPLHQLAARRQALDAVTLANEESVSQAAGVLVPAGRSIWLYEGKLYTITSPLSFFSLPDFHPRMFSEHFPSAYEDWLERL